jgi:hypothetical protein
MQGHHEGPYPTHLELDNSKEKEAPPGYQAQVTTTRDDIRDGKGMRCKLCFFKI